MTDEIKVETTPATPTSPVETTPATDAPVASTHEQAPVVE